MKCPHCQEELGLNNICINPACSYFSTTVKSSEKSNSCNIRNTPGTDLNNVNSNKSSTYFSNINLNSNNDYNNINAYNSKQNTNSSTDNSRNIYDDNNISIEEFVAFIGSNNVNYYLEYIHKMQNNNKFISWNWPCFFLGPYWLLYRKLYALASVLIALTLAFLIFNSDIPVIIALIIRIILAMFANSIYLNTCEHKINLIKTTINNLSTTQYINRLHRKGGVTLAAPLIWLGIYIIVLIISVVLSFLFSIADNPTNFSSPSYYF